MARVCVEHGGKTKLFSFSTTPDILQLHQEIYSRFGIGEEKELKLSSGNTICDDSNLPHLLSSNSARISVTLSDRQTTKPKKSEVKSGRQISSIDTSDDLSKYIIPQSIIHKFWNDQQPHFPAFTVSELTKLLASENILNSTFIQSWKKKGFFVLELPPEVVEFHSRLIADFKRFTKLPLESKALCSNPQQHYLGYKHRPHFNKELFQVRKSNLEVYVGEEAQILKASAEKYFTEIMSICKLVVNIVCNVIGIDKSKVDGIGEDPNMDLRLLEDEFISQSNCSVFHYNLDQRPVQEFVHCPYHTDVGLVTVIPKCTGVPGLHVFDLDESVWRDFERDAPDNYAVVFGGESLARLSNNFIGPCYHEVSNMEGERFSAPVQYLAYRNAKFDYNDLDYKVVGTCCAGFENPTLGAAYVNEVSASRISSNFPRMM